MPYNLEHSNAQSNRWFAAIHGLQSVEMKLVDFTLPMLSVGVTDIGGGADTMLTLPGDRLDIDEIQLNFIVDKRYLNYYHCYMWMRENLKLPYPNLRDITISLLDNQNQFQGVTFTYTDCFPIMLAPVNLDAEGTTHDIVMGLTLKVGNMNMQIEANEDTPSALVNGALPHADSQF